ncbi:MAG: ComF family protein [Gemmatimonadetes bacterium]|nr:ComF family protein [Gemmatimonadota bacterium]
MPPSKITGLWDDGYALDLHTRGAGFLGYDQYGHALFDTHYTELGDLLYKLKYGGDSSGADRLAAVAAEFVRGWKVNPEVIVPVPPSRVRVAQPLVEVAQRSATELNLTLDTESVKKTRDTPQLKSVIDSAERRKLLNGAFSLQGTALNGRRVLLFDDLFRSGATMNAVTKTLKESGVAVVFALALTRTRSRS